MSKKSIVFMGTPVFSVECLKKLVEQKFNILGVITSTDKQRGRGRKKRRGRKTKKRRGRNGSINARN